MKKIIVDSGCDGNQALFADPRVPVEVVPLHLQVDDRQFTDDKSLDIDAYLEVMEHSKLAVKTAAPSPEGYKNAYSEGESAFCVTLSGNLSGSYSSAMLGRELYHEEKGSKFIHVFDSLSASVGEMVIAFKIKECIMANLPDVEIVETVKQFISGMRTFFILEKFDNLVKTGRMKPYIAKIASVINIKPICAASSEGKIVMVDKARGYKKALEKLVSLMAAEKLDFENRILGISHVRALDKALALKELVMKHMHFKEIVIVEASGLCSTYANREGIILAY